MACMLYIRWRTNVNKVAMNIVKNGCSLNEPTCIKVKPVDEKSGVSVSTVFMKDESA